MKSQWWSGARAPRPSPALRGSYTDPPTSPLPPTTTRPHRQPVDGSRTWPLLAKAHRQCHPCQPTTVPLPPAVCSSTALRLEAATAAAGMASAWGRWHGVPRAAQPKSWTGSRGSCTTLTPPPWRAPGWRRPTGTTTSSWPPSTLEARYRNLVVGCTFIISSALLLILTTATWWRILDTSPYLSSPVPVDRWTVCVGVPGVECVSAFRRGFANMTFFMKVFFYFIIKRSISWLYSYFVFKARQKFHFLWKEGNKSRTVLWLQLFA